MTHIRTQEIQDFQTLAEQVNWEHQQAEQAARSALEHALKAGELLIQAKLQCAHGEWQAWIKQHCQFAERSARLYMQLARERSFCTEPEWQRVADLPLREAIKCLVPPPAPDLKAELGASEARLVQMQQQLRLLQLAHTSAKTIEDLMAVVHAAEQLISFAHLNKMEDLAALGRILKDMKKAPRWERVIFKMITQGGESAQAAFQAINDRIKELEQEQVCGQQKERA